MEFVYFGIIIVIVVGIILFMPKRKKGGSKVVKNTKKEKLANKATAGAQKVRASKQLRVAKQKAPVGPERAKKDNAVNASKKKQRGADASGARQAGNDLEPGSQEFSLEDKILNDDNELLGGFSDEPDRSMKEITEDEAQQSDDMDSFFVDVTNEELSNGLYSPPVPGSVPEPAFAPAPEPVPESGVKQAGSDGVMAAPDENLTSSAPDMEISLGSEPVVTGRHVRRKLVQESAPVQEEQKAHETMEFVGSDLAGFESPTVDDIFSEPDFDSDDYSAMLFSEVESDTDSTAKAIQDDAVAKMIESVEQVSSDLEPIEGSILLDERENMPEPDRSEESAPDEAEEAAKTERETLVQRHEEPEKEEAVSQEPGVKAQFTPGSVSFTRNDGLRFRKRSNRGKVSELLPDKFAAEYSTDDVILQCQSANVHQPVQKNGILELYNSHVYRNGKTVPWDVRFELQLCEGDEATVDTGIGIRIPEGYGIELVPVSDLESKYGLELLSQRDVSRLDAMFSLKFTVRSIHAISYVQKNKALIGVRIIRI